MGENPRVMALQKAVYIFSYPALVMLTTVLVIVFMMTFIVPF